VTERGSLDSVIRLVTEPLIATPLRDPGLHLLVSCFVVACSGSTHIGQRHGGDNIVFARLATPSCISNLDECNFRICVYMLWASLASHYDARVPDFCSGWRADIDTLRPRRSRQWAQLDAGRAYGATHGYVRTYAPAALVTRVHDNMHTDMESEAQACIRMHPARGRVVKMLTTRAAAHLLSAHALMPYKCTGSMHMQAMLRLMRPRHTCVLNAHAT
jgi:hypothetical protein